jgi:hypothetical protein
MVGWLVGWLVGVGGDYTYERALFAYEALSYISLSICPLVTHIPLEFVHSLVYIHTY